MIFNQNVYFEYNVNLFLKKILSCTLCKTRSTRIHVFLGAQAMHAPSIFNSNKAWDTLETLGAQDTQRTAK